MPVNAILLAGASNTGPLRNASPATSEALIDIGGKPMVQYVIDGLLRSNEVERVAVVSPTGALEPHVAGKNLEFVPCGDTIIDNVLSAARIFPRDQQILIVTCDIPLITGEVIDDFIALCRQKPADLYYPIVEKSVSESRFPGVKRTYVHLREGIFTGGNLFLISPTIIESTAPKIRRFLDYRKKPLKLAGLLGLSFVLRYLIFKNLSIKELEQKVSEMWALSGAVIICPWAEIGIDVDKPSDLQLVRSALLKS